MKNKGLKSVIISELISKGVDFEESVFGLHHSELSALAEFAKECKYRKPKNSYFGLGGAFFLHLQKIYKADRLLQSDLNNL